MKHDARKTELIRQAWSDSGKVYGYRKLAADLRDQREQVSEYKFARLASLAGILAQVGYKRRPGEYGGKPDVVASNTHECQFEVHAPDKVWVTNIKSDFLTISSCKIKVVSARTETCELT